MTIKRVKSLEGWSGRWSGCTDPGSTRGSIHRSWLEQLRESRIWVGITCGSSLTKTAPFWSSINTLLLIFFIFFFISRERGFFSLYLWFSVGLSRRGHRRRLRWIFDVKKKQTKACGLLFADPSSFSFETNPSQIDLGFKASAFIKKICFSVLWSLDPEGCL